ncbi:ABC-type multidrug transport system ATPase and permease component [Lactococcus lactis subsp. lactis]|uniref:ABC-type multidrug transport system ATPase and permease component n=1 Tax=Lactococcus lactis subsp. lactis TaxID=1360 RepID=A0A0V8DLB3_LACLL|nr:hypothetical protein [Lactococcus lactis]KSU14429.1 ABC-type multidrug transport system ATPase and permease component [Lactococcus lactis subsp. lactis]
MRKFKSYFLLLFEGLKTFSKASRWGTLVLVILVPIEALVPTGIIFYIQKVTTELAKGSVVR